MAYHGYIPLVHEILSKREYPSVLEIGVNQGITAFALIQRLTSDKKMFCYTGVDILLQSALIETLKYFHFSDNQFVKLFNHNSLEFLSNCNEKYDVILIDGDHNYFTVLSELQFLDKISHEDTVVICDDYDGRWSEQDMFYSERDEYSDNKLATPRIEKDKKGVKAAVDEFLEKNPSWKKHKIINGEPIVLMKTPRLEFV